MKAPYNENLIGRRYGRLIVVGEGERQRRPSGYTERQLLCQCDCGNELLVLRGNLASGNTASCGCLRKERTTKHGMHRANIYDVWLNMKERCLNPRHPSYPNYGGRGIAVCQAWVESFGTFYADVGNPPFPGASLDRKDNNRGYEPGNVRWATRSEQNNNRRSNRLITWNGETRTLMEWARLKNLRFGTIRGRLNRHWPVDDVLNSPPSHKKYKDRQPASAVAS